VKKNKNLPMLLTLDQAAFQLGITLEVLMEEVVSDGLVKSLMIGSVRLVPVAELHDYIHWRLTEEELSRLEALDRIQVTESRST
jgi:hypothetical protein